MDHAPQENSPPPPPPASSSVGRASLRALTHIALAVAIGAAGVGYLVGIRAGVPTETGRPLIVDPQHVTHGDTPGAVSYSQMRNADLGPNAQWTNRLPAANPSPDDLFAPLPDDPALRERILTQRAASRAYDGAPPVVPHRIDQTSPASCMACHANGMKVGTIIAPHMSHEPLANCTQCHVESNNLTMTATGPPWGANVFVGKEPPGPGDRAWEGAPPTIPHTTWMRQNCSSCHGTLSEAGLRTSHPWRTNCTQCHAPSAELDQRVILDAARPPIVELIQEVNP